MKNGKKLAFGGLSVVTKIKSWILGRENREAILDFHEGGDYLSIVYNCVSRHPIK